MPRKSREITEKTVEIGDKLIVEFYNGQTLTFTVGGPGEGNPDRGVISCEAPLAKAILGKKQEESAAYTVGEKILTVKIISILK